MAESGLSPTYTTICANVGYVLGYGADTTEWSTAQQAHVDRVVARGIRSFYSPPVLPGERMSHEWSFMRPQTSLDTVSGTADYDLPDNFGGMAGGNRFAYDTGDGWMEIPSVRPRQILDLRQGSEVTGRPKYAAIVPKAVDTSSMTRFEVWFWPTPDAVYTLLYFYIVLPNAVDGTAPYPLGIGLFGNAIEEACMAQAESDMDVVNGPHSRAFLAALESAVRHDSQHLKAQTLGIMRDGDGSSWGAISRTGLVTYKDQLG